VRHAQIWIGFAAFAWLWPELVFAQEQTRVAAGATIATGPTAPPARVIAKDEPWFKIAFKIDGGVAIVPGEVVGGYGRLGADFLLTKDPKRAGLIWGVWEGYEGWIASGAGGFALPIVMLVGYRAAPFMTTLGGGFNLFAIDHLAHDTGAGIFSPRAELRAGLDLGDAFVTAGGEIQRRWMWGRDDITIVQAGLSIGYGRFQPPREPEPRRR
jgi:hypothetical protein